METYRGRDKELYGKMNATTTGIEPLFAVAYKRRYLTNGTQWKYEYVVDATAERMINEYGIKPERIDTAYSLSGDFERRIAFQASIQDFVDMSISSTINLPTWGTKGNCEAQVERFAACLAKYAPRLRGFTAYPDGSRGGQPITEVDYTDAIKHKGIVYTEHDVCDITGHGGSCGV
jgi:ribonucleoside-diphosphate reductase alpha chain